MAINYPTSLDTLTNPTSGQGLNSPSHATQHADANDAIEALEAKVGANSSAVTTSHDYKLGEVTGSDKAVGKTATQTLTNKTLTSPVVNIGSDATGDMYYRNSGGVLTRLPIGTSGQILNVDGTGIPAYIANPSAADASTTVKGVVEEATQAEFDAGTTVGGTSARLFTNPSTVRARLVNTGIADTGSANAVAIAPSPAITAYAAYQEFTFKAAATNTGATTINVNALGTKNIYKNGTSALTGGEIVTGGVYTVVYDGTQFQLVSANAALGNKVVIAFADASITNTATETALVSQSIPGNILGTSNALRVRMFISAFSTPNGSPDNITLRFKYGATTLCTFGTIQPISSAVSTCSGFLEFTLFANAATNAQKGIAQISVHAASNSVAVGTNWWQNASGTSAIDSTSAQTLAITGQWGSNASSITVSGVIIEKIA